MVFGTNTAAAFPLLYPSVGFGPLLWTTAQRRSGQALANMLVQQQHNFAQTSLEVLSVAIKCGNGTEILGFEQLDG